MHVSNRNAQRTGPREGRVTTGGEPGVDLTIANKLKEPGSLARHDVAKLKKTPQGRTRPNGHKTASGNSERLLGGRGGTVKKPCGAIESFSRE